MKKTHLIFTMELDFAVDKLFQPYRIHIIAKTLRTKQSRIVTFTNMAIAYQGPVVQSIVSLASSLRGQLVQCFTTLQPNTLIFFVEKMREAFALQKLLTCFQQKYWLIDLFDISI